MFTLALRVPTLNILHKHWVLSLRTAMAAYPQQRINGVLLNPIIQPREKRMPRPPGQESTCTPSSDIVGEFFPYLASNCRRLTFFPRTAERFAKALHTLSNALLHSLLPWSSKPRCTSSRFESCWCIYRAHIVRMGDYILCTILAHL